jgi:hypothetical protein
MLGTDVPPTVLPSSQNVAVEYPPKRPPGEDWGGLKDKFADIVSVNYPQVGSHRLCMKSYASDRSMS